MNTWHVTPDGLGGDVLTFCRSYPCWTLRCCIDILSIITYWHVTPVELGGVVLTFCRSNPKLTTNTSRWHFIDHNLLTRHPCWTWRCRVDILSIITYWHDSPVDIRGVVLIFCRSYSTDTSPLLDLEVFRWYFVDHNLLTRHPCWTRRCRVDILSIKSY